MLICAYCKYGFILEMVNNTYKYLLHYRPMQEQNLNEPIESALSSIVWQTDQNGRLGAS